MEETQNMSPEQVKTLLTRIGENTKFIISGDLDQSDKFRDVRQSGLYDAMQRHKNIDEIGFFLFENNDIVRNPIITKILKNYETVSNDVR
jgi:phosphate starvation-inducible PhoH-like protein